MDERNLISRIQSGDPGVFADLYDRYAHRVLGFLLRSTGNRDDAEDLLQDVLVAAYRARADFRGESTALTFLLGIAVRRQRDWARQRRPESAWRIATPLDEERVEAAGDGGDPANGVVTRLAFSHALMCLDPPLREALLLVHSQGLTYREAAAVVGAPVGTVKWRVREALKRMHRAVDAMEEECDAILHAPTGADYGSGAR
jgi:RNA polymerase sigma-70 factor (ECF subfamily)